jgi:hypothetical protein
MRARAEESLSRNNAYWQARFDSAERPSKDTTDLPTTSVLFAFRNKIIIIVAVARFLCMFLSLWRAESG